MKLVILDRDGVINLEIKHNRIVTPEQWEPIPGSIEAIIKLKTAGYSVVVATNQSIISKKIATTEDLAAIHYKMQQILRQSNVEIDKIFFCPHQNIENCACRKPKPGMLLDIAQQYNLDFAEHKIPFVGDATIDVLAAVAAQALPVLVKTGKGMETLLSPVVKQIPDLLVFDDLKSFVDYWINID